MGWRGTVWSLAAGAKIGGLGILLLAGSSVRTAQAASSVLLNEVLYDAVGTDTGNEWIELFNPGSEPVDVSGWRLESGGTSFMLATTLPDGTVMAPGAYLLVGESAVAGADIVASLAFQNGGSATDGIRLVDRDRQVVDLLLYDKPNTNALTDASGNTGASFAADVPEGHSLARIPNGVTTGSSAADFRDMSVLTPGAANDSSSSSPNESPPPRVTSGERDPTGVVVNEVLPDPVGADAAGEFLELFNPTGAPVELGGAKLDDGDGGSSPFILPSGTTLASGGYLVFTQKQTGLVFNNDGDGARLLASDGRVLSELMYPKSPRQGVAWARTADGSGVWTATPTAGELNVLTALSADDDDAPSSVVPKSATTRPSARAVPGSVALLSLAVVRDLLLGAAVQVSGVVTAPTNVLGPSTFYLADATGGMQVFVSNGDAPVLAVGDRVSLRGIRSSLRNEARVRAASADIQKIGSAPPPRPRAVSVEELGEALEGILVRLRGEVESASGNSFTVDDGSGLARVLVKESVGWKRPEMHRGQAVDVVGIVSQAGETYRLLPRFAADIILVPGSVSSALTARTDRDGADDMAVRPPTRSRRSVLGTARADATTRKNQPSETASPSPSPTASSKALDLRQFSAKNFSPFTLFLWSTAGALALFRLFVRRG